MLTRNDNIQLKMEVISLEELIPEDHLLRKIENNIDFSFIYALVKDKYCENNGRPSIDPVILFKMIFIGYLYGIRSERRLVEEIKYNIAYRWFLGIGLKESVPNSSTISQNRRRRFRGTDIYERIFENILEQAITNNLVSGNIMYVDSTHVKANANIGKFTNEQVEKPIANYVDELEEAVNQEREKRQQKKLKKNEKKEEVKNRKVSTTDPDSGYMFRDRKPKGFFYLNHMTVDGENNIITGVHPTSAAMNDAVPFLGIVKEQKEKFGYRYVGADAGYYTAPIAKGLKELGVKGAIAKRIGPKPKGKMSKLNFKYVEEWDVVMCLEGHSLEYKTTTREGYMEYHSKREICCNCPKKEKCLYENADKRIIRLHVWDKELREIDHFTKTTDLGKRIYKRRKETIERAFADLKELHGFRYARFRGLNGIREQSYMSAAAYNMKKIARFLHVFLFFEKLHHTKGYF